VRFSKLTFGYHTVEYSVQKPVFTIFTVGKYKFTTPLQRESNAQTRSNKRTHHLHYNRVPNGSHPWLRDTILHFEHGCFKLSKRMNVSLSVLPVARV